MVCIPCAPEPAPCLEPGDIISALPHRMQKTLPAGFIVLQLGHWTSVCMCLFSWYIVECRQSVSEDVLAVAPPQGS